MNVLIAGGTGFMGSAFVKYLRSAGHQVWILTRRSPQMQDEIHWDGESTGDWGKRVGEMDAVVNMTGFGLEHWPWTKSRKEQFRDSRVKPGQGLVSAIKGSAHRPGVFIQISGINYYGSEDESIADEWTAPGQDFLAQLAIQWENATRPVEELGFRRVVARTAVILDRKGGLFPLMALPVRLFAGGRLGSGRQAVPWIHIEDQIGALRFLMENGQAAGAYNLISPTPTTNEDFVRAIARALHRPYWLPIPAFMLGALLGEMNTLVVDGRFSLPKRLLELGYQYRFPTIEAALGNLFDGDTPA